MTSPSDLKMVTPTNDDMIREGDDAITANAVAVAKMYDYLKVYGGSIANGSDLNDYRGREPGTVTFYQAGSNLTNAPTTWPGFLTVEVSGNGKIMVQTYTRDDLRGQWARNIIDRSTGIGYGDWKALTPFMADAATINKFLIDDFTYRRGGIKRMPGARPISIRIDHGLAAFKAKVKPHLDRHRIPYALAINSSAWGSEENAGITPEEVNSWIDDGLCEIWSHGYHHSDTATEGGLKLVIEQGKADLEAQLPSAKVDGWMPAGVGTTYYDGFRPVDSMKKFTDTFAGQLGLRTFPIVTGDYPGSNIRVQDGVIRHGMGYLNFDKFTPAQVKNRLGGIQPGQGGQLMVHPRLIDSSSEHISSAQVKELIDWLAAEHKAGRIYLCSAYEQYLIDATPLKMPTPSAVDLSTLWPNLGLNYRSKVVRSGTAVSLVLNGRAPAAGIPAGIIGSIPPEFAPPHEVYGFGQSVQADGMQILTTGEVRLPAIAANAYYKVSVSWAV